MTYIIDYQKLEVFWQWLVKDYPKSAYTEIRLMSIKDDVVYSKAIAFANQHPDILIRKSSQFFIKGFEQLKQILKYDNQFFAHNSKICYSLNPRFVINNDIAGGYTHIKFQNKIFFDIERKDHNPLSDYERIMIKEYVLYIAKYLERQNLTSPTIVQSGGGMHLLYRIESKLIDAGRKESYKQFILQIAEKFDNKIFHIDAVYDLTRTVGLVETLNPKNGFKVNAIQIGDDNEFFIRKIKLPKLKKIETNVEGTVRGSLVWRLISTNNLPTGDLNNVIVFYLKMLIRDLGEDYREYEAEVNVGYSAKWNLSPSTGINGKIRDFGLLVNWCKLHYNWCVSNGIDYKEYKY